MAEESPVLQAKLKDLDQELEVCTCGCMTAMECLLR